MGTFHFLQHQGEITLIAFFLFRWWFKSISYVFICIRGAVWLHGNFIHVVEFKEDASTFTAHNPLMSNFIKGFISAKIVWKFV